MKRYRPSVLILKIAVMFSVCWSQNLAAQVISNIIVVDSNGGKIEFVSVNVFQLNDSLLVASTVTDSLGAVGISLKEPGNYRFHFSRIGYKDTSAVFSTIELAGPARLITLLTEANALLPEVKVSSNARLIVRKADRVVVNVRNSPLAVGKTAYEVLSRAPGIRIDREGDIRIGAKSGSRIMIGNKLLRLSGTELIEYLQALRAEDISSIEIIAQPPASFDAEGIGGIVKINLKHNLNDGYNGGAAANFSQGRYQGYSLAANGSVRKKELEAFASVNVPVRTSFYEKEVVRNQWNTSETFASNAFTKSNNSSIGYRGGVNYMLSKKHLISVEASGSLSAYKVKNMTSSGSISRNGKLDSSIVYNTFPDKKDSRFNDFGLNYKWDLDTSGAALEIAGNYYSSSADSKTDYNTLFYDQEKKLLGTIDRRSSLENTISIATAQADLSKKLSPFLSIETGIKYSGVNTEVGNHYLFREQQTNWMYDQDLSGNLSYKENILAGYGTASITGKNMELVIGLRVEGTDMKIRSLKEGTHFTNTYLNFFPSVFLKKDWGEEKYVSVNYVRRIIRPPYQELNPYRILVNENTISEGNPRLKPSLSNGYTVSCGVGKGWDFSLCYSRQNDVFGDMETGTASKTILTTGNIAVADDITLDAYWTKNIMKGWNCVANLSGTYNRFKSEYFDRSGQYLYATLNNAFTVNTVLDLECNGRLFTKSVDRYYTELMNSWVFDIGASLKLFKRKVILSASLNDIFYRDGNRKLSMDNTVYKSVSHAKWDTRRFAIGLRWRFVKNGWDARQFKKSNENEVIRVGR